MSEQTEQDYQSQLFIELHELGLQIANLTGTPIESDLEAIQIAKKLLAGLAEKDRLLGQIDRQIDDMKPQVISHFRLLGNVVDEKTEKSLSPSKILQLIPTILSTYYNNRTAPCDELRKIQQTLEILTECEERCTSNNWASSKDGIIQALTLRLCGESRDRLRRLITQIERG